MKTYITLEIDSPGCLVSEVEWAVRNMLAQDDDGANLVSISHEYWDLEPEE